MTVQVWGDAMFALSCQGGDLRAAEGNPSPVQFAFCDEKGPLYFVLGYVQLGGAVQQLGRFLSNYRSDIVHSMHAYASMFA